MYSHARILAYQCWTRLETSQRNKTLCFIKVASVHCGDPPVRTQGGSKAFLKNHSVYIRSY